ncbi:MAG TPA: lysophospholipid acyltransferase family protein, partial [Smithellaceae bacterium]|nr:lysophospholipid acyltransferase family protein [Smithellaceae bacterium]
TIVKKTFFHVPVFGWFLRQYGFIPSAPAEMMGEAMLKNLESIRRHLAAGGNLFIFPEGTRSRDGRLAPFNRGVFSIARYCNAPLALVLIKGTDRLFKPGTFLFNTHASNEITMELIASIEPGFSGGSLPAAALSDYARRIYLAKLAGRDGDDLAETQDEASG